MKRLWLLPAVAIMSIVSGANSASAAYCGAISYRRLWRMWQLPSLKVALSSMAVQWLTAVPLPEHQSLAEPTP